MSIEKKVKEIVETTSLEYDSSVEACLPSNFDPYKNRKARAGHITQALLTSPDLVIMEREKWEKIIGYLTEYEEWFPCLEVEEALGEGKMEGEKVSAEKEDG